MSLENEAVVDDSTNLEENLNENSEGITSEQPESEKVEGVAAENQNSEQVGETEEDFNLSDVLTGKAEPDEKEPNVKPRSTAKAQRRNKRLKKENELLTQQLDNLKSQQLPNVQAQAPERDWDNETDEQYNFRSMQAVLQHQQQVNNVGQQHANKVKQASDDAESTRKVIDTYSDEVDKLNLPNYDDSESRVLDMMPEGSLAYMSNMNPSATAKIIYHLDHNPEKAAHLANLAHTNAAGFNYEFGKLETAINELESKARRSHKKVSKAVGDKALDNSGISGNSVQKKMDAAANSGDFALYRKLKSQNKK